MSSLLLRDQHTQNGALFGEVNGIECALSFGDTAAEFRRLRQTVALLDFSHRGRLCVIGPDRVDFLHGQVTNNVKSLGVGEGCLAALVDHKGKIQSDLSIHRLNDELLLDFEPGLIQAVVERLEKFIIAEDVELVDVAPHYGLLSLQGPQSPEAVTALFPGLEAPVKDRSWTRPPDDSFGESYLVRRARIGGEGFDLFVPNDHLPRAFESLKNICEKLDGGLCGWEALEAARIEAGFPRQGIDMDETTLVSETGIAEEAISYAKGCYIGQEVIARIRTYGRAKRKFCRLQLPDDLPELPAKGTELFSGERKAGWITSAVRCPDTGHNLALGYVATDFASPDAEFTLAGDQGGVVRALI